jgi:hypothetical protein
MERPHTSVLGPDTYSGGHERIHVLLAGAGRFLLAAEPRIAEEDRLALAEIIGALHDLEAAYRAAGL